MRADLVQKIWLYCASSLLGSALALPFSAQGDRPFQTEIGVTEIGVSHLPRRNGTPDPGAPATIEPATTIDQGVGRFVAWYRGYFKA
jgi:hypothetical protein